jgi:2-oxoglutarate ferredoxin oxidoreductase subunit alpha
MRYRIKIVGFSGSGSLSVGDILAKGFKEMGYYILTDREFPSLIQGGSSAYTMHISDEPIYGMSSEVDMIISMDKKSLIHFFHTLVDGGTWVHGYERLAGMAAVIEEANARKITQIHMPAISTAKECGGNALMANMVMTGLAWKALNMPYEILADRVRAKFAKKPKILAIDLQVLQRAYDGGPVSYDFPNPKNTEKKIFLDGAHALALGAVHAGLRLYVGYPMSPSTGILKHVAAMAKHENIAFKQAEDEITAAQMTIGGMYAGTRAMTATSGGGFDLMTESLSLVGIMETPWVCIIAQRPGPATGLPTWTGQGDLNLAVYAGHGEYARVVIAVSDPEDSFYLIQHAFNLAEKYQVPVIVLTEKEIVEGGNMTIPVYNQNTIPIERGLVTGEDLKDLVPSDRFKITESGLSKRWIPTSSDAYYFSNGDEHWEDGTLTEDAKQASEMYAKRVRKEQLVLENLPEPEVFGNDKKADISFIGWGSSRKVMRDIIKEYAAKDIVVNYLHFSYVWPIRTARLKQFVAENANVHLIEGNYTGQLGGLLDKHVPIEWKGALKKWDGRTIYLEDVSGYIDDNMNKNG